jgi:Fur family ferric uptake transcriptional regulator
MTAEDRELLRAAYGDGRSSAQRLTVAHAAACLDGAFRVEDLAAAARRCDPRIGTATVYRAVGAMAASGFLEQVGERGGTALYARCGAEGHHHHLVCTGCGAVAQAPCPLDRAAREHAAARGFVVTHHQVHIYGLCARCAAGSEPS